MKALSIPAQRTSMRGLTRSIGAAVSNLRNNFAEFSRNLTEKSAQRASLTVAIAATVALFAFLGLMYVPGIVISGLTALTCCAIAPMGDDAPIEEGGEA